VLGLQTTPAVAKWQFLQQSSLESSQTAEFLNLQVAALQQVLFPHDAVPPQSQSSPSSTMPLPHCWPVMVVRPLLSTSAEALTLLRPRAEQMLPMEQGLKSAMPSPVEGFMMYLEPASQVVELRGQHCCALTTWLLAQVEESQSCTAPKVCPDSWAMTCHSVLVLATMLAPLTISPADFWTPWTPS